MRRRLALPVRLAAPLVTAVALTFALADPPPTPTFGSPMSAGSGSGIVALATGDFDGDGKQDVAASDTGGGVVLVHRGNGNAGITQANGFSPLGTPGDLCVADFDGDGKPDLAFVTSLGVQVTTNGGLNESDALLFTHGYPQVTTGASYTRIAAGDVNGDQRPDLAAVGPFSDGGTPGIGILSVWMNDGSGGFPSASVDRIFATEVPDTVAVGDLSGDQRAEILAGATDARFLHIFFNPGTGAVDLGDANDHVADSLVRATDLEIADVTADGRPDIVLCGTDTYAAGMNRTTVVVLPTKTGPTAFNVFNTAIGYEAGNVTGADAGVVRNSMALADLNGDAVPELVVTNRLDGKFALLVFGTPVRDGSGDVTDMPPAGTGAFACGADPFLIALADYGGSAAPDVVAASTGDFGFRFLLNGGTGGGGGDGLAPATNLAFTSKRFPGNTYQDGQKFTFTCTQPDKRPGVEVRLQSTETPNDEGSWTDIPVTPYFLRAKKAADPKWTCVAKHVPPGVRYFRTITSRHGETDGINTDTTGPAAYIGPFTINGRGPVLVTSAFVTSASDPLGGATTHVGDTLAYLLRVENSGSAAATRVRVSSQVPVRTQLVDAAPAPSDTNNGKKLEWEVASIAPGERLTFGFTARVIDDATGSIRLDAYGASAPKTLTFQATGRLELFTGNPLRITAAVSGGSPQPGSLLQYDLECTNGGGTPLGAAVAADTVPAGTAFASAQFLDADGNGILAPDEAPAGRSNPHYDPATRRVFWYFGEVGAGEVRKVRLNVFVGFDRQVGGTLLHRAYEFRGCSGVKANCNAANFDSLDQRTENPADVTTTIVGPAPADVPVLRLGHEVRGPTGPSRLYDPQAGDVAVVSPGDTLTYVAKVSNATGVTAQRVRLLGTFPAGVPVPANATVQVESDAPELRPVTADSGGSFSVDLGPVGDRVYTVTMTSQVPATAKNRTMLVFRFLRLENDSITGTIFGDPNPLNVLVALPYVPYVESRPEIVTGGPAKGPRALTQFSFLTSYENRGGRPGTATLEQEVPAGCAYEAAAFFDAAGQPVAALPVQEVKVGGKPVLRVPLGTLAGGAGGTVKFTFSVAKAPKSGVVTSKASLGGNLANTAKGSATAVPASTYTGSLLIGQDSVPALFVVRVAPHVVRAGLEFVYTVIVGNPSDHDANGVVATMAAPKNTKPVPSQSSAEFGTDGTVKRGVATWNLGTIPAHSAVMRQFRVIVNDDAGRKATAILEDTLLVRAANATGWKLPTQASLIVVPGYRYETYAWPAFQVNASAVGMVLGTGRDATLDDAVRALSEMSCSVMSEGEDIAQFTNGAVLCPLGDGNVFAVGPEAVLSASAGTTKGTFGLTRVITAPAGSIVVSGIPAQPALTATDILSNPLPLVQQGVLNLVAGGSGTLVGLNGRSLIDSAGNVVDGVNLARSVPTGIVAGGGGNIVAGGGGNIVAGGGGNIVAAGGGNIVAAGGGNIVAGGGGNIVAAGGGNIVAAGGGNIVAAGGGNIVAGGGGNIVAGGGGNIVAGGGGNIVAGGGGN